MIKYSEGSNLITNNACGNTTRLAVKPQLRSFEPAGDGVVAADYGIGGASINRRTL